MPVKNYTEEELNAMPLHKLLGVALTDLAWAERTPGFVIDMSVFVSKQAGPCRVCLGGSVMARRERFKDEINVPDYAVALDVLRLGAVSHALDQLGRSWSYGLDRKVRHYHTDRDQFLADMEKLRADLKEAGL